MHSTTFLSSTKAALKNFFSNTLSRARAHGKFANFFSNDFLLEHFLGLSRAISRWKDGVMAEWLYWSWVNFLVGTAICGFATGNYAAYRKWFDIAYVLVGVAWIALFLLVVMVVGSPLGRCAPIL